MTDHVHKAEGVSVDRRVTNAMHMLGKQETEIFTVMVTVMLILIFTCRWKGLRCSR